jgi:hypothetical protein
MAYDIKADDGATDLVREMRERWDRALDHDRDNRKEALVDLKFVAGEQWPDSVRLEREGEGRPVLTINRMPQFVRQITGDLRQNRPSIKVRPVDGKTDPALAKVYTGMIRSIEQRSDAQEAYIGGVENAARCGIGHWRILTDYVSDDVFEQDIVIQPIVNPFAVVWDPESIRVTREDANWCFVVDTMPLTAFTKRWPNAKTSGWDGEDGTESDQWFFSDEIRVAEYWCKVPVRRRIALMPNGDVLDLGDYEPAPLPKEGETNDDGTPKVAAEPPPLMPPEDWPADVPFDPVAIREVESYKVVRHMMSGCEELEPAVEWAGRWIPIVPVIGEQVHIGERLVRHGVVRFARDPQQLYNYWRTTAAETIALAPKAPWLVTKEQIKGQEALWQEANVRNLPYLVYTPDSKAPGVAPQRVAPAPIPSALLTEANVAADDMKATTGIYDAALGAKSNETSGRAIMARQQESDVGALVYTDNLARSIRHTGVILVDLIPKIYDTERIVRTLGEDDAEEFIAINQAQPDGTVLNDITIGKYDVMVTVGPSYATKRMEASDSLMTFIQAFPQAAPLIGDLIAKNQDWPGAEQIAERLKKILPPGVDPEAPQPPPDPRAEIEAQKMQVDVAKTAADAEKTRVETQGKQLDNAQKQLELAATTGQLQQLVQQMVVQTLQQIMLPAPQPMPGPPPGMPTGGPSLGF